jgi:hypothetical protein
MLHNNNVISNDNLSIYEIKKNIDNLNELELAEIFKILKFHNEKYSVNNNGIFFSLSKLSNKATTDISNFIKFCNSNKEKLKIEEDAREEYKKLISED